MGFKFKHLLNPVKKILPREVRRVIKDLTPVFGTVAGTILGGPAGGILGGALAGASTRGGHNRLKGALKGAAHGTLYQALAPTIANSLGATISNSPVISSMTGLSSPSLLHQLGMSAAPAMGGGLGLIGNAGNAGLFPKLTMGKIMGNALGALQQTPHMRQPFEYAAMEFPEMGPEYYETFPGQEGMPHMGRSENGYPIFNIEASQPTSPLSPLDILRKFSPQIPFGKYKTEEKENRKEDKEKPKKEEKEFSRKFAQGGNVKLVKHERTGHIKESDSGGQDDDIYMDIPPNAYVMNATDVSLFGDGSSSNGVKKLRAWENSLPKNHFARMHDNPRIKPVKAMVSNDEVVLKPSTVIAAGGGNIKKGVKVIDKMRDNLRKQKGVKKILPPRTKPMNYYMKGGS